MVTRKSSDSGKKKPTVLVDYASTKTVPISSGPGSATSTNTAASSSSTSSADLDSPQQWIHPFAGSTAKLEIIPSSATSNKIDVEEEARLYDELCRSCDDDDTDSVSSPLSFLPLSAGSFDRLIFYSL